MRIRNLTPHQITIVTLAGITILKPSGDVARVENGDVEIVASANGIPIVRQTLGEVIGLPGPERDTLYVVSLIVATHCGGRGDVVSPGTGPAHAPLRDADGRITAVRCLVAA